MERDDVGYLGQGPTDQQAVAEMIACLVLRTGLKTEITVAERQAFYRRFPRGFGLVVLAQANGSIALTVESTETKEELRAMVEQMKQSDGTLDRSAVPARYLPGDDPNAC